MQLPFPLAPEPDDMSRENGRLLFARGSDFLKGVVAMSGLPPADRIEVCFAGRSNVGKSSLINALTGRKGLARASNTPGRTQEINFFTTDESHYLVDLPSRCLNTLNFTILNIKTSHFTVLNYIYAHRISLSRITPSNSIVSCCSSSRLH